MFFWLKNILNKFKTISKFSWEDWFSRLTLKYLPCFGSDEDLLDRINNQVSKVKLDSYDWSWSANI